ncbi:peptidase of plants and bacteria-domain-containing protein [Paraphoma chrysanthemicola]|uniref:Peptidase of plants and bacteria-domain-containing protein n=1 Tax=Paraphoma chrysanthemicola TaxID=798071 RepID=A0A8K0VXU8_9PLEO|nr:peptidase of plants and bacteria-domain-containing protein [Paraphoma chrysanthemicola]
MSSEMPKYYQVATMPTEYSSSTPPPPQSSALPPSHNETEPTPDAQDCSSSEQAASDKSKVSPPRKPLLRLELRDLSSHGARAFLRLVHASAALEDAVDAVLRLLYQNMHTSCIPPTRSVTLVLRDMEGVAYTTGLDLDDDHKEIHLSTKYIEFVPESRQKEEILGVLVHEMVHCWQHSGFGTAPVGLTEGVADWVRLKAGYAPPHWKRHTDCDWDAGYERTGYFLQWLERDHGADIVRKINEALRGCNYEEDKLWHDCCGTSIKKLWKEYKKTVEDQGDKDESSGAGATTDSASSDVTVEEKDDPAQQEDHRTPREKARRGGNMHVPVRPGTSS